MIHRVHKYMIDYNIDTAGGQSGSPVWTFVDPRNIEGYVFAIHAYGGCPNSAVRVYRELFNELARIRDM